MTQQPIELILMRELADNLATPIFVIDPVGTLEFYNEPAEKILGRRFDETGPMTVEEWATAFAPTDDNGVPLVLEEIPLVLTLRDRTPRHGTLTINGLDGKVRHLSSTAVPLLGRHGNFVGAAALFWESRQ